MDCPNKLTYTNGRQVTYTLNQANQITQVDSVMGGNTKTLAQTIAYYPFGPMKEFQLGNNLPLINQYDTDYQLTTLKAGAVINRNYQYDETGNITQIINMGALPATTAEAMTYSYQNNNNQLTQAINGTNTTYGYNAAGNLITELKNGTTRTFTYNGHQRLVSVSEGATVLGEYTYDALGRRTKKVAGETTTLYLYDKNGLLIAEYTGDGTWEKDYVYLNGQPLTMIVAGTPETVYYYHNDHLGTPQLMTDSTGTVVWAATYDPFGKATINVEQITNNLRFPGQYFDAETGLHYNWNRYYDTGTGRYITADPIGLEGGINLFAYVDNNPINKTDVWGLEGETNGCGPADWREKLVPNKPFLLINFKPACDAHDRCYGKCGAKKAQCDKNLLGDMGVICYHKYGINSVVPGSQNPFLTFCFNIAEIYYSAVSNQGQSAFDEAQKHCSCNKE